MTFQTWQERQRSWRVFLWSNELSQKLFAERYGFNQAQLSQWLSGKQKIGAKNEARIHNAFWQIKGEGEALNE